MPFVPRKVLFLLPALLGGAIFRSSAFADINELQTPVRAANSTHVFHQYTLQVANGKRDELVAYLESKGIPAMMYYPLLRNKQIAFAPFVPADLQLPITEKLCASVVSLPMHTELYFRIQNFIYFEVG